MRILLPFHGQ
jgi:hypothetical protein